MSFSGRQTKAMFKKNIIHAWTFPKKHNKIISWSGQKVAGHVIHKHLGYPPSINSRVRLECGILSEHAQGSPRDTIFRKKDTEELYRSCNKLVMNFY